MSSRIVDIEQLLRDLLLAAPFSLDEPVFLQFMPESDSAQGRAVMIRREDTIDLTQDLPIDTSRVQIMTQDKSGKDSFLLMKEITDQLHGITPQALGVHTLLSASLDAGPERRDQDEVELRRHVSFWVFRVRVQD